MKTHEKEEIVQNAFRSSQSPSFGELVSTFLRRSLCAR
jgi:hypothetical protein